MKDSLDPFDDQGDTNTARVFSKHLHQLQSPPVQSWTSGVTRMIYEERQTLSHSRSANEYLEYCKTNFYPKIRSKGGQPLCLLSGLIGDPANQYLQITAFENVETWEAAQREIPPSPLDIVESESVRLLRPIASRPKQQVPLEDRRAVYGCRRFFINSEDMADFVSSSESGIWPRIESQGACVLGLWTTIATTQPMEILLLTGYHSPSHWEETRVNSRQQDNVAQTLREQESPLRDRRVDMTQRTWVRLMRAHEF